MNIPQGSFWVYRGQPGKGHVHRVVGVMGASDEMELWKEPTKHFLHPSKCVFHGHEQVEIATWSVTPILNVPMGMDSGTAGFSWLGPLKEFAKHFEPYQ